MGSASSSTSSKRVTSATLIQHVVPCSASDLKLVRSTNSVVEPSTSPLSLAMRPIPCILRPMAWRTALDKSTETQSERAYLSWAGRASRGNLGGEAGATGAEEAERPRAAARGGRGASEGGGS